jgi:cell division protein FtsQ
MTIFISVLIVLVSRSKYFNVKNIVVTNNKMVATEEIKIQSQVEDSNIFFISKKDMKQRISANPYIDNVEIRRKLPYTIIINVREKKIKGIVKFQSAFINVDSEGRMIQAVSKFPDGSIPLIAGIDIKEYVPNGYIFKDDPISKRALKNALSITDYREYRDIINSINVSDPYNIVFSTKQGVDIKIGSDEDIEYKLTYAYSVLNSSSIAGNKGYIQIQPDGTAVFKKY